MTKPTQYIDPTGGLTNRELDIGRWLVRHRDHLRQGVIAALILWSLVTVGYSAWGWGSYLIVGARRDEAMVTETLMATTNYRPLQAAYAAKPLSFTDAQVFKSGDGKFDFAVTVYNPNPRHVVRVEYAFGFSGGKTPVYQAILLPMERRPLPVFGFAADAFPKGAGIDIIETRWLRLNPHRFSDVPGFMSERLQFAYDNVRYAPAELGSGILPSVSLRVQNNSAYSFWQPEFYLELISQSRRVGIVPIVLSQFRALDARDVNVRLFGDAPGVTDVVAHPVVNIFDPSVFMKPGE